MLYLQIFTEIVGGYIALFVIIKFLGKTQISQITPFDFISALVLGEFVGSAIFDKRVGLLQISFSVIVWGGLIFITETITQKSRKMRYVLEGRPSMIVNQGKLDWKEMKENQLDIDQLLQLLRSKDVFSLQEVEYAILETNGGISVLRKSYADYPTMHDLNIKGEKRVMPLTFISDGEIIFKNLEEAGLNKEWLQKELAKQGYHEHKDISYAEWKSGKELYIQNY